MVVFRKVVFTMDYMCLLRVALHFNKKGIYKCEVVNLNNETNDYRWDVLRLIRLFFCRSAPGSLEDAAFSLHFHSLGGEVGGARASPESLKIQSCPLDFMV